MSKAPAQVELAAAELRELIQAHGAELSAQIQAYIKNTYPPSAEKGIRNFSPTEVAKLIGIHDGYLRQVAAEGKALLPPS